MTITNAQNTEIFISTLRGELLLKTRGLNTQHSIDISGFIDGLYLVSVNQGNAVEASKLLID